MPDGIVLLEGSAITIAAADLVRGSMGEATSSAAPALAIGLDLSVERRSVRVERLPDGRGSSTELCARVDVAGVPSLLDAEDWPLEE